MVILDTDVLVGLLRQKDKAVEKVKVLEQSEELCTTSINSFELFKGAELSPDAENKREDVEELLKGLSVLHYDVAASRINGRVSTLLQKQGKISGVQEEMIASVALAHNARLVTRNIKHFKQIPNLLIEEW